jgi:hypothetical protein
MEVSGKLHAKGALPPGKEEEDEERKRKIPVPPENQIPVF